MSGRSSETSSLTDRFHLPVELDADEENIECITIDNVAKVKDNVQILKCGSIDAEPKPKSLSPPPKGVRPANAENFLNLELHNKSDYDRLLKQHVISSFPSAYVKFQDSTENQTENSNDGLIFLKSELPPADNSSEAPPARRRPSSSSSSSSLGELKPTSRAATPTGGRPMKPKPSRASTLTSLKPMSSQKRTSAPSRATSYISTALADSKPASRHVTPTRKPETPLVKSSASGSDRVSSGRKTLPTALKNPVPSRGALSQAMKSIPSKPPEMLSSSHDVTETPITSLPKRPTSTSRGRPCAPATRSSSASKPRQMSCSPPKIRPPNCNVVRNGNKIMLSKVRGYISDDGDDHVNPVVMGTKMVERVVNMRKLAPPKQDDCVSIDSVKKSSLENSGFGRSLSKKSLDMAIRHMDIRRSIPDDLRPMAAVLSPSACGIQSSSLKGSRVGVSESPLTSSNDSSKSSNGVTPI
ncbi:hypothetical protein OROGR_017484 [Orobanche gracilis]